MNNSQLIRSERRKRERQARRDAILEAGREVFFAKGLMGATVDEIAHRAGLAKGTIYLYFQSKEEIYVSLMKEGTDLLKKEMEKVGGLNLRSDRLLERLMEVYYGFYKKHRDYFKIIFLSSHPDVQCRISEELCRSSLEGGRECLSIVSSAVKKGIESGLFRKVDPWAAANVLWATANGVIMIYEQDPRHQGDIVGMDIRKILKTSLDIALKGIIKR